MSEVKAVRRLGRARGTAQGPEVRRIPGAGVPDDEVARRVTNSLDWSVHVPRNKVKVKVSGGVVTLTGEVDWQYQKTAALQNVAYLYGVGGVISHITIKPHAELTDIKCGIETAVRRQAEAQAFHTPVTVKDAGVRLNGKINAWADREAAQRLARVVQDARVIDDHVTVITG